MRSRNEPMAKPLASWLVRSFSQHNLHLVVPGRCLHVSVTKFQDKFASWRQVNSPYSSNKFQICCTDMYLIRFLPNFGVFFVFLWISRDFVDLPEFRGSATARNVRSPVYYRSYLSNPTSPPPPPSPWKMNVRVLTKIFNQFIKMIPYSGPKFSGFYTLSQTNLLQNHTLDSSTYLELIYNSTPPPLLPHPPPPSSPSLVRQ